MIGVSVLVVFITTGNLINSIKGCGRACEAGCFPRDCRDIQELGFTTSGLYHVTPVGTFSGFDVWCDLETESGGWLVFQRRQDGSENFNRSWKEYQRGFGDLTTEHWLGNLALHAITSQGHYELRVELEDWDGNATFAQYDYFNIDGYEDKYRLAVSGYSGTAGDSLGYHDGMVFDTYDVEASWFTSTTNKTIVCSLDCGGGWWYGGCYHANLNGDYSGDGTVKAVSWRTFRGYAYSLKRTEMKIRRI